jgi:WD40 repeat protein
LKEIWRYQRDGSSARTSLQHAEFAPDGRHIAIVGTVGGIALLDTHAGKEVREYVELSKYGRTARERVVVARFAHQGKLLIAGRGTSTNLGVWQASTGKPVREIEVSNGNIQTLSVGMGDEVLVGYPDDLRLVNFKTGRTVRVWPLAGRGINTSVLDQSGDALYWGGRERTIFVGRVTQTDPVAELRGHAGGVVGLALSTAGDLLASVSVDRHLILWDTEKRAQRAKAKGHTEPILSVDCSSDGSRIATSGINAVRMWDRSGKCVAGDDANDRDKKFWRYYRSVCFSSDGQRLVTAASDGVVQVWQVP